ncbi:MAG: alkane 1-monooxygenase [Saprospiraceae bacterium]|nr:alkane 1-monooxygenase [Saprospiraceae bacterium]
MNFSRLKYLLVYTIPAFIVVSLSSDGWGTYATIIFTFIFIPLLELFMSGSTENLSKIKEAIAKEDRFYDYILYALVPMQYAIMFYFLHNVSDLTLPLYAKIGMVTAFGISCGVFGINAAHELGHRNTWYEQLMSKLLLLTSLYMHFFIEHNRGHHKHVSTDEDPASSRYGEVVYTFYFRSVIGGWLSAWRLEASRLKSEGKAFWSIHNEMLRFQIIQLMLILAIGLFFNLTTLLFFLVSATMGFLLLETVNYIEHYGLRRKKKGAGYERTLPIHSWNSNHPLGRLLLLELSRHSDHHFVANRKYQTLRHFEESPQMPTGYPGMVLLSLFPPLWFMVMHQQLAKYTQVHESTLTT